MAGIVHNIALAAFRHGLVPNPMAKALEKGFVFRTKPTQKMNAKYDLSATEFEASAVYTYGAPKDGEPLLYYGHGGGYLAGMFASYFDAIGRLYKALGMPVIAPDYPMPPDVDAARTREWTLAHFRKVLADYPNSPIIVAGDSAGANLALALVQELKPKERKRISGLFMLYSWLDLTRTTADYPVHKAEVLLDAELVPEAAKRFAGDIDLGSATVSPMFGDLKGLPDVYIVTADLDMLYQDSIDFRAKAEAAGNAVHWTEHKNYAHDFWLLPTPDGQRALKDMAADMKACVTR